MASDMVAGSDMAAAATVTDAADMAMGVLDMAALAVLDTAERGRATVAAHGRAAERHLADLAAAEPAAEAAEADMQAAVAADIAKLN